MAKKRRHELTIRVTFDKPVGENEAVRMMADELLGEHYVVPRPNETQAGLAIVKSVTRKIRTRR